MVLHAVGLIGLLTDFQSLFILLTPLHLMITLVIVLRNFPLITFKTIALIAAFAWLLEFIGVNTGLPFGDYQYGETLGWKIGGTPLLIAANWIILLLSSNSIFNNFKLNIVSVSLLSATAMTSLDFFIEPVAIQLDFWSWSNPQVPWNNYLSWFLASFVFSLFLNSQKITRTFRSLNVLFYTQVAFFVILFLFL